MHKLPQNFDGQFMIGKTVETICFAAYQVNIYLSEKIWIQVEGRYKFFSGNSALEAVDAFPISQSLLLQLIQKKIVTVSFLPQNGNAEIVFESGHRLLIDGDIGPYESYRIFDGKNEIVV